MEKIYLKARGKVNLTLNVLDKRKDGYHNLESVFQKINLYDEMWVEKLAEDRFKLDSNIQDVKVEDNIIYKAYQILKKEFDSIKGVKVKLNKKLPMQAGLAGGSTDCASFILGVNKLYNLNMGWDQIKEIGSRLGADVVPCLYNRAVKAKGIGDVVEEINTDFKYYFVIIKPKCFCSTKEMYNRIDEENISVKSNTQDMVYALENSDINLLSKNLFNSFEIAIKDKKEILEAKQKLLENGAISALLSGSGSCVFGIFENKELAKKAYRNLKTENYEAYICTSYNSRRKEIGR